MITEKEARELLKTRHVGISADGGLDVEYMINLWKEKNLIEQSALEKARTYYKILLKGHPCEGDAVQMESVATLRDLYEEAIKELENEQKKT